MLTLDKIGYDTGGRDIFSNVSFSVNRGDKIGLVGKNGVGKTTLLGIMAGNIQPTSGRMSNGDYAVGRLPQDLRDWLDTTVYDFVENVTGVTDAREGFEASCEMLSDDPDGTKTDTLVVYADALDRYTHLDVPGFDTNLEKALVQAGIPRIDVDKQIGELSGGQRTKIALAAILASRHDVVLLDEPTNNLDDQGVEVLETYIYGSNAAFVIVSHDRRLLRTATNRIVELVGGEKGVRQYSLGYDEFVGSRDAASEAVGKQYDKYEQDKRRLKQAAVAARSRANSASRSGRASDGDKLTANFRRGRAAGSLSRAANSLSSRLEQLEEPERPEDEAMATFRLVESSPKHRSLVSVTDLVIDHGDGKPIGPISLHLHSGERLELNGENGSGKSSVIRAIIGEMTQTSGKVTLGNDVPFIYMDQSQTLPYPDETAVDNIKKMCPQLELHDAINALLRSGFSKDAIHTKASEISGGERAKVLLAAMSAQEADLIILDEPTNNLDITSIEALERAIREFKGGLLVVSHDREFKENIGITKTLSI